MGPVEVVGAVDGEGVPSVGGGMGAVAVALPPPHAVNSNEVNRATVHKTR